MVVRWDLILDFVWMSFGYYLVMSLVVSHGFLMDISMIDAVMMGIGGGVVLVFLEGEG